MFTDRLQQAIARVIDSDSPFMAGLTPNSLPLLRVWEGPLCTGSSPPNRLVSPRSRPVLRGLMAHTQDLVAIWADAELLR